MEYFSNPGKRPEIDAAGGVWYRHAIKTHFFDVGESMSDNVRKYVLPLYRPGDILIVGEKAVSMCQGRVVYTKDLKIGLLAKILAKCAKPSEGGPGITHVEKMQAAVTIVGPGRMFLAGAAGAFGKLVGKRGWFFQVAGREAAGMDGFYDGSFKQYGGMGVRVSEHPERLCNQVTKDTGVPMVAGDINDYNATILGKSDCITLTDEQLMDIIRDNPANNGPELTPFVLLRPASSVLPEDVVHEQEYFADTLDKKEWYDYNKSKSNYQQTNQ